MGASAVKYGSYIFYVNDDNYISQALAEQWSAYINYKTIVLAHNCIETYFIACYKVCNFCTDKSYFLILYTVITLYNVHDFLLCIDSSFGD